jgi:hypothetical protein
MAGLEIQKRMKPALADTEVDAGMPLRPGYRGVVCSQRGVLRRSRTWSQGVVDDTREPNTTDPGIDDASRNLCGRENRHCRTKSQDEKHYWRWLRSVGSKGCTWSKRRRRRLCIVLASAPESTDRPNRSMLMPSIVTIVGIYRGMTSPSIL